MTAALRPVQIIPGILVGPKLVFQGNEFYRLWKLGPTVSGIKIGPMEISLGCGVLNDAREGRSGYFEISSGLRF